MCVTSVPVPVQHTARRRASPISKGRGDSHPESIAERKQHGAVRGRSEPPEQQVGGNDEHPPGDLGQRRRSDPVSRVARSG
jgi:hypothetical protein